ncbi:MAG: hypothetical protein A2275_08460 [Bacteroidetes bacterium RIFOXYA12_FULL_35_11]|nr:MAG: hypothetical protein A2X01_13415 [Bacteroidetes bacterium GWF2_35_48]OFY78727.1 MAG: hypothetical protein A2275_08460 [Bacteroidetes bacterium RIFOXYA12_FULL_35_11]OFY93855.1 MAG: hypothetical protein A2491_02740 [Bacteroidetes bacterium RIFOXYC12_FULL_35_7]OFY96879.1 MAG: hypothetical protein A2309_11290 [Bacteroidetes bacterium RIFOXYB2_FULL_35_7]HBX52001.1 hypothetical protein [Bacteroidales bacterium]
MKFLYTHITLILLAALPVMNSFLFINTELFFKPNQESFKENTSTSTELGYFNINAHKNNVALSWSTIKEIKNSIFLLERSHNGGKFSTLKKMKNTGNNATGAIYKYYDQNLTQGVYYYRLTELLDDDEYWYHTIEVLNIPEENNICFYSTEANPCVGKCTILFSKCPDMKEKANGIYILDAFGNKVFSEIDRNNTAKMQILSDKTNQLKPAVFIVRSPIKKEGI